MFRFDIPGRPPLEIIHLVLDLNGTLCVDGDLLPGVAERIRDLAQELYVHVVTADTHGTAARLFSDLPVQLVVLPEGDQDKAKRDFVRDLGASNVAAMGNGCNDRLMLAEAALGVALLQTEGAFATTLLTADVVCREITDALDLLLLPRRLLATLRR
ncbi:MAG: ATPase P [Proteobacteria bacterium]|nr:ATPase P [Pseudomonadota bacterium]